MPRRAALASTEGVVFKPFASQLRFVSSLCPNLLMSGGMGAGKTDALVVKAHLLCTLFPGIRGLIGRRTYKNIHRTTIGDNYFRKVPQARAWYKSDREEIQYPNGSLLLLQHLDLSEAELGDAVNINLGFVAIDQLDEVNQGVYELFETRMRQDVPGLPLRPIFSVCNPAGHNWMYTRWIRNISTECHLVTRTEDGFVLVDPLEGTAGHTPEDYRPFENEYVARGYLREHPECEANVVPSHEIIHVKTTDNKNNPSDYLPRLLSGHSEAYVRRNVYGSWDSYEGQVYDAYDERVHVVSDESRVPPGSEWLIAIDHGQYAPTAVLLCALDYDDDLWIVDEHYAADKTTFEHVGAIREMVARRLAEQGVLDEGDAYRVLAEWRLRNPRTFDMDRLEPDWDSVSRKIRHWVIDPRSNQHQTKGSLSPIEEYARYGINLVGALHERDNAGVNRLQERFQRRKQSSLGGEVGAIHIFARCGMLREELTLYQWDTNDNDRPKKFRDHAPNAMEFASSWFWDVTRPRIEHWSSPAIRGFSKQAAGDGERQLEPLRTFRGVKDWRQL